MKPINEIMQLCADANCHFFEHDTMRFFKSKVVSDYAAEIDGGAAYRFITSEQFDSSSPRLFTVRELRVRSEHRHVTVGEFQQHKTKDAAKKNLFAEVQP